MNKVKEIFTQLQSTNSKLEKQKIIKDNADNQQFTDTLIFLLSPYVLTGMSERKINKKVPSFIMLSNIGTVGKC